MKIAIIGGTGLYQSEFIVDPKEQTFNTKYGDAYLVAGRFADHQVYFLNRHGTGHKVPPHLINYRANIFALKQLEVEMIIATAAVGSLREDIKPGSLVVLDQFIDFTYGREQTFFTGEGSGVVHVDLTEPYCPQVRKLLIDSARQENLAIIDRGTYVCTQGPRFETPAEIAMFARLGGDVVGMTNVPEVVLAREAEICYGTVAIVTNYAAGISPNPLTHQEVLDVMSAHEDNLKKLFKRVLSAVKGANDCSCRHAVTSQGELTGGVNNG